MPTEQEVRHAVRIALYVLNQLNVNKADMGPQAVATLRALQEKMKEVKTEKTA